MKLIRLEIAKTGTFGAQGSVITLQDLKDVVETFDGKCPVSLGHYMAKQDWWPSWGNVENIYLREDENGEATLIADISINETLYDAMQEGFYPSWSVSIPQRASDGKRYLHHLAFVGATPPKIRDLKLFGVSDGVPENAIKVESEGFGFADYATYSYAELGIEGFTDLNEDKTEKKKEEVKAEEAEEGGDPKKEEPAPEPKEEVKAEEKKEEGKSDFSDSIIKKAKKVYSDSIKAKLDLALKDKIAPAMMDKVYNFADLACESYDFADDTSEPAIISLFLEIVNSLKTVKPVETGKMVFADNPENSKKTSAVNLAKLF